MSDLYTLTAVPDLLSEGEFKDRMEYVTFHAVPDGGHIRWFEINRGQFTDSFRRLVHPAITDKLLTILRTGEEIQFPASTPSTRSTP
jgi:hypothetical protein